MELSETLKVSESTKQLNCTLPHIHLLLKLLYLGSKRIDMVLESLYEDFDFISFCKGINGKEICSADTFTKFKVFHNVYADFRKQNLLSDVSIIYFKPAFLALIEKFLLPTILSLESDFQRIGHLDFIPVSSQEKNPLLTLEDLIEKYEILYNMLSKMICWV